MDRFAGSKVEGKAGADGVFGNVDPLMREEMRGASRCGTRRVPEGFVAEGIRVEVGAEVAVEANEDITVKGGRNPAASL